MTLPYAKARFDHYNALCFNGSLPEVPFVLTRAETFLGKMCFKTGRGFPGRSVPHDFHIRLSSAFDLPETEWDDVIVHEMIHLYIASNNFRDTSAHGRLFREMMDRMNRKYGMHMAVSHRKSPDAVSPRMSRRRVHCVCVSTFPDGRQGVTVCSAAMAHRIDRGLPRCYVLTDRKWYVTDDLFFNRFPHSRLPRIYRISGEDLAAHLSDTDAVRLQHIVKQIFDK